MIPLYTQNEFDNAKSLDKLPLKCHQCNIIFYLDKRFIINKIKKSKNPCKFCSPKCYGLSKIVKQKVSCLSCLTEFEKLPNQINKTSNNFCSRSCAATYNNKHKTTGTRRSKLEIWLENQLTTLYPHLHIDFNKKDTIESELDIYIPSLNLAFELNGIFHYEPIYGSDKLNQIRNNDTNKFQKCIEHGISLCIVDTSGQKYFKESTSKKYLDIIVNIINQRTSVLTS